jgi:phosphatidylethanolamine/phosphatidyl-N-methylethanolamine N-methyltransferase
VDDGRVLFQEFLRAPTRVATVTASSDALVAAVLAPHRLDGTAGAAPVLVEPGAGDPAAPEPAAARSGAAAPGTAAGPVVVELGAGTGRVTDAAQRRLGGRGRHLAIEINPVLAARLAARHAGVTVVAADVARLPAVLAEHGVDRVDALVSLLPWAAYAAAPVPELAAGVLAPSGTFTQVTLRGLHLLPPARRQLRDLRAAFGEVSGSATVWRNLPPARILIARSPRRA